MMYLALYVDDMLIASEDLSAVEHWKKKICEIWQCKDMGEAKKFLGINVSRHQELIHLSQTNILRECIHLMGMQECKPVNSPALIGEKLKKEGILVPDSQKETYHSVIGKLLYVANHTRPDLSVAVGILASFVSSPTKDHWIALKRVIRYCKATLDYGITLGGSFGTSILVGYGDADWGSCLDTRRSRSGYTFHLGIGCVSHQSKKAAYSCFIYSRS
jgi:hypothetical protein